MSHLQIVEVKEGGAYAFIKASHHIGRRLWLYSGIQPQPDSCNIHCGQPADLGKLLYAQYFVSSQELAEVCSTWRGALRSLRGWGSRGGGGGSVVVPVWEGERGGGAGGGGGGACIGVSTVRQACNTHWRGPQSALQAKTAAGPANIASHMVVVGQQCSLS